MTTRQEQIQKLEKGLATGLIPDNLKPAMEKKLADLKAAEAAESGTAAPAGEKPTKEEKPKKERKPRAKKEGAAPAKRGRKPKAEKPAKRTRKPKAEKPAEEAPEETTTGGGDGKPQEVVDCEKIIADWNKGRAKAKMARIKSGAKPVFEKISDKVELAVEQAIKSIPAKEVKENPSGYISKFERLKEAASKFLAEFRSVLGGEYEGDERNEAIKDIENLIAKLKDRFMVEKKEEGGKVMLEIGDDVLFTVDYFESKLTFRGKIIGEYGNYWKVKYKNPDGVTLTTDVPKSSVKKEYAEGGSVSGPDDYTDQMMISGTNEINHERQVGDIKAKGGRIEVTDKERAIKQLNKILLEDSPDAEPITLEEITFIGRDKGSHFIHVEYGDGWTSMFNVLDLPNSTVNTMHEWIRQEYMMEQGGKVKGGRKYFGMGNFF